MLEKSWGKTDGTVKAWQNERLKSSLTVMGQLGRQVHMEDHTE